MLGGPLGLQKKEKLAKLALCFQAGSEICGFPIIFIYRYMFFHTLKYRLAGHATRELLGVLFSTVVGKTRLYVVWYLEHITANVP